MAMFRDVNDLHKLSRNPKNTSKSLFCVTVAASDGRCVRLPSTKTGVAGLRLSGARESALRFAGEAVEGVGNGFLFEPCHLPGCRFPVRIEKKGDGELIMGEC